MAPTVYFADIGPVADHSSDSESDESQQHQQVPTVVLGYGVSDLRMGRRMPVIRHRPRSGSTRLMADASRHPTSRDAKARPPSDSITTPDKVRPCPSRRKGLLDVTLRTVALIRRNRQLQLRLTALQAETRAFVRSVMSNPENRGRGGSSSSPPDSDDDDAAAEQ